MPSDTAKKKAKPEDSSAITPEVIHDKAVNTMASKVATVALVGLGAALIEVELIPGIMLGVAAMLMPDLLPKLGRLVRPMVKGTVRAGYAFADRAREVVAEAGEHMDDIVAEVRSETDHRTTAASSKPS